MSLHSDLFGWEYVWRNFADDKGGEVVDNEQGAGLNGLVIPADGLTFTFTPFVHNGRKKTKGTTVMTSFVPASEFVFAIQTEKLSDQLGKVFGLQDVKVDDQLFDSKFLIQGNDEVRIRALFEDIRLRESLLLLPPSIFRIETESQRFDPEWIVQAGNHALVFRLERLAEKTDQLQIALDVMKLTLANITKLDVLSAGNLSTDESKLFSVTQKAEPQPKRLHSPLLDRS
jgi:hypothetical protein